MQNGGDGLKTVTRQVISARLLVVEPKQEKEHPARHQQWQMADAGCTAVSRPVRHKGTVMPSNMECTPKRRLILKGSLGSYYKTA